MPNWFINIKTRGANKSKNQVDGLTGSLGGLSSAAKKAAIAFGVGFLGKQIYDGGRGAIKTASEFELLRVRLDSMYGSAQRGSQAFDTFNKVAAKTPFQLQDVVDAGASLKAFGLDAENMVKPLADLAAFMQVDMSVAASTLGRAFVAGAGAADQFREKGINQMVADMAGVSDATKLSLTEYRKNLQELLLDPSSGITGMTAKMAQTWSGAVSNMQDNVDRLKAAIGDELIKMLKPRLDRANKILGELGEIGWDVIAQTMFSNFEIVLDTMSTMASAFGDIIGNKLSQGIASAWNFFFGGFDGWKMMVPESETMQILGNLRDEIAFNMSEITRLAKEAKEAIGETAAIEPFDNPSLKETKKTLEDIAFLYDEEGELQKENIQGVKNYSSALKQAAEINKENSKEAALFAKRAAQLEIIVNTASAIMEAAPNAFLQLSMGALGAAQLAKVEAAQFAKGGDFITDGPQMIMVGDDAGGISGNVMSQDFVEGELSEQIKDAVRRGISFA